MEGAAGVPLCRITFPLAATPVLAEQTAEGAGERGKVSRTGNGKREAYDKGLTGRKRSVREASGWDPPERDEEAC